MSSKHEITAGDSEDGSPNNRPGTRPHLFLSFECERPLSPPARHRLDVEVVQIGRGDREATRAQQGVVRVLSLKVPDRWMSMAHAALKTVLGRWQIEDLGSKNGTLVNGKRVERGELADGDLIQLGHTFFHFRAALPVDESLGPSVEADPRRPEGLSTLNPNLAAELRKLEELARSPMPIVVLGESGTGKEVLARALHQLSGRAGAFQAVNCGALPQTLVESELFGYRKGAFSGAAEDRPGLIRSADRGTLFLDEIGDLPRPVQAVLLRVLQESEVLAVGATRAVRVDLRVLSATHRDLDSMVERDEFRADLMARLSGFTVRLPALRERREDLGLILAALLRRLFPDRSESIRFLPAAARALLTYPWPLNVRELEKCLGTSVILAGGRPIDLNHLSAPIQDWRAPSVAPLPPESLRRCEEIKALLEEHGGNITAVAEAMGKARAQVQRWIKRCRINVSKFKR